MSGRRAKPGEYPNLRLSDIVAGGSLALWRNPAEKPFGDQDAWTLTADWSMPEDIDEAYRNLEAEESKLAAANTFAWDSDFGYLSPIPAHCSASKENSISRRSI